MEPYNVKIITYPDLTRQIRIYKNIIEGEYHPRHRYKNPFDDYWTTEVDDFDHVAEVSMKRTKKKIYDYAKSNSWDWFVTFTFSSDKVNRYDYDECIKKLSKWLNNLRRSSPAVSYVVVPERHKDGAWHFHGLFAGLSDSEVVWTGKYVIKKYAGADGRNRYRRTDQKIYRIGRYKLGWMTATSITDKDRVTSYITKYITKDMMSGLYGRKRYWCSRNLLLPTEEVLMLDSADQFILKNELLESARFHKCKTVNCGSFDQTYDLFDL